jgi:hypothetical protein
VEIEAVRVNFGNGEITQEVPSWLRDALVKGDIKYHDSRCYLVRTLEGIMRANEGDWLIQGVEGEIYPCKDSVFQATYDPV